MQDAINRQDADFEHGALERRQGVVAGSVAVVSWVAAAWSEVGEQRIEGFRIGPSVDRDRAV